MNSTPLCRWNFRVLAARRVHVLWIVPLACVIASLAIGFQRPETVGSAVLQIRPGFLGLPAAISTSGAASPEAIAHELRAELLSPELLREVVASEGLTSRWGIDENSAIIRLGKMVDCRSVPDTNLVVVRVRGPGEGSQPLCRALIHGFMQSVSKEAKDGLVSDAVQAKAAAEQQENLVEQKRAMVSELFRLDVYSEVRRQTALKEFQEAQRALEKLKIQEITKQMELKVATEPVMIHEEPADEPAWFSRRLRLLLVRLSTGLAAGIFLTIVILYLLEWLFPHPRRSDESSTLHSS